MAWARLRAGRAAFPALVLAALTVGCGGQAQHGPVDGVDPAGGAGTALGGSTAKPLPVEPGDPGTSGPDTPAGGGAGGAPPAAGEGGISQGGSVGEGGAPSANEGGETGAGGEPPVPSCDPIVLEDADVEYMLRAAVQKPSGALHPADVAGLTYFAVKGVKSIRGVECLTDLESFSMGELPFGHVTDISPLAALKKLQDVDIGLNPVAGLAPLGKLPQLRQIFASHIPVELDLTPLANAPKLELLYLQSDTVKDLAPLGSAPNLRSLNLRLGHVVHPEGVAALTQLEDFDATAVFDDVAPLATLTSLRRLLIPQCNLEHFSALKTLTKMRFLDISSTGVASISAVSQMTDLEGLDAANNQITQTEPLGALSQLSQLILVKNHIVDLGPLAMNEAIANGDFLYLEQNDFACAAQAVNLQVLQTRGVHVSSDCQ